MQASQSSTASDLPPTELQPDQRDSTAVFPRGLPSPFSAPILAARKYFERQRGEAWHSGARETETARSAALGDQGLRKGTLPGGSSRDAGSREGSSADGTSLGGEARLSRDRLDRERLDRDRLDRERLEHLRRERDRRLERSLYEGSSTEAGADFEAAREGKAGLAAAEQAGPSASEVPEELFPFAAAGLLSGSDPDPDPETVRGAILRLSRESELHLAAPRRPIELPGPASAMAGAGAAKPTAVPASEPVRTGPPVERPSFGDVARRVWGTSAGTASAPPAASEKGAGELYASAAQSAAQSAAGSAAGNASGNAAEVADGNLARNPVGSRVESPAKIPANGPAKHGAESAALAASSAGVRGSLEAAEAGGERREEQLPLTARGPGAAEFRARAAAARPACAAGDRPALAHDACNLLSALALYSELLASPGVLGEQHRHYAEELKLMAGRSQVLIDRLLGTGAPASEAIVPGDGGRAAAGGAAAASSGWARDSLSPPAACSGADSDSLAAARAGTIAAPHPRATPETITVPETDPETVAAAVPGAVLESGAATEAGITAPASPGERAADLCAADLSEADLCAEDLCAEDLGQAAGGVPGFTALSGFQAEGGPAVAGEAEARPEVRHVENGASPAALVESAATSAPDAQAGTGGAPEATSLVYLLMRWGSLLSTLAQGTLEVVFGPHAATPVPAGAEALERILVNLVRNARAATAQGGAIRISVGAAECPAPEESEAAGQHRRAGAAAARTMVLTVDDSGCGMTASQVRRILGEESAVREREAAAAAGVTVSEDSASKGLAAPGVGEDSLTIEEGALQGQERRRGLGLQIVRQLVAASGGELSIQSWPGRGTRVEIRWPVTVTATEAAAGPAAVSEVPARVSEVPAAVSRIDAPVSEVPACVSKVPVSDSPLSAARGSGPAPHLAPVTPVLAAALPAPRSLAGTVLGAQPADKPETRPGAASPATVHVTEPMAGPGAIEAAGTPRRAGADETAADALGPDGFSEAELRAMMLRLHRTGPQQRAALNRSPGYRGLADWERSGERTAGGKEAERGSGVPGSGPSGPALAGPALAGSDDYRGARNDSGQRERAAKGAIAC